MRRIKMRLLSLFICLYFIRGAEKNLTFRTLKNNVSLLLHAYMYQGGVSIKHHPSAGNTHTLIQFWISYYKSGTHPLVSHFNNELKLHMLYSKGAYHRIHGLFFPTLTFGAYCFGSLEILLNPMGNACYSKMK